MLSSRLNVSFAIKASMCLATLAMTTACNAPAVESDRFVDAIVTASAKSTNETHYMPSTAAPYAVALLVGPTVDPELLRKAGVDGPRLESIVEAAPKDFRAAIAVATIEGVSVGWFLGNFVLAQQPTVVRKAGGESVIITLKYGGSLPEVVSVR